MLLFSFGAITTFMPLFKQILTKINVIDMPSKRRTHIVPTPKGAGALMILIIVFGLMWSKAYINIATVELYIFLTILSLLAITSFIDDIREISPGLRFIIHIIASLTSLLLLLYPDYLFSSFIGPYYSLAISTIALIAFLNIYNFMDGVDGLTAAESIHLSVIILLFSYLKYDDSSAMNLIIIIATLVIGTSLGFILFNWHPARIFIGDVGSITIGFLLGLSLIMLASLKSDLLISLIIASLYYIMDGGLTILIRIAKGEKIWQPHLAHFFQKALRKGFKPNEIVIRIVICNLILMILSISALYAPIISFIIAIIATAKLLRDFSACD